MVLKTRLYTVEEFELFITLPENEDRLFELIGGRIYEVPSNPYSSKIAALIIYALIAYLKTNDIGHVTGEAGGYRVSGERYAPDVAYISYARQPELPYEEGYNPNAPDLAVEVWSPSDTDAKYRVKIANYLATGTVVWVVNPPEKIVEMYAPGTSTTILDINGTIDGGAVLPGFTLPVKEIFPE